MILILSNFGPSERDRGFKRSVSLSLCLGICVGFKLSEPKTSHSSVLRPNHAKIQLGLLPSSSLSSIPPESLTVCALPFLRRFSGVYRRDEHLTPRSDCDQVIRKSKSHCSLLGDHDLCLIFKRFKKNWYGLIWADLGFRSILETPQCSDKA